MSIDSDQAEAFIGTTVHGEAADYKIVSAIGAGGMGAVFLGETEGTGRKVAVKFLHEELSADDSSSRERFEREMRVLQDLKAFRGIVQFEDGGKIANGQMFLVMEYVAAPTLDKIISDNANGLVQIRAIQIVVEILSVLEPIHHRRFVHRDLKPHNICVYDEPLAVRLLDFGLSKPYMEGLGYEKVTRRMQGKGSEIPGSPHYMAVEQFLRPKEVDARTDLYSCGIILYELLAGIPPFRGIYLQDILQQHKESSPPPIDNCADGGPISYRLWAVVEKSLSKKAESRYQSAAEFKEALFDVLNVLNKRERPKKQLDTKYRMIKKIGVGGNSEVFEVEAREGDEKFALKIAREGASDWDEETLMNEADRALNHENIVRIFEFGTFEGRPALAMELLEGGSLEDVLEASKGEGIPENVFYRTMIDICRGLHHAHQKNIVHRDVKPGNMLRSEDGRTKVCDFGIAKRFEQSGDDMQGAKNTTLAKGTAQYISPEQCDLQGRVDRRADVYCLGVMMYEMLAGELPFTDGILIMQHLQTNPPPLFVKGEYRNPDELCKIVGKAMHKSPDLRYQSMKELAQDLVRVSKLEAQKKTHKAFVLDTIPEEWKNDPARGGAATEGMTQTMVPVQTGVSAKKVGLIVAGVVAALVAGFILIGGSNNNNSGNNSNEPRSLTPGDPARAEAEACRDLVDGGDLAALASFKFEALAKDSEQRNDLGARIWRIARNRVFQVPVNRGNASELISTMRQAAKAASHVAPTNTLSSASEFADHAAQFLKSTDPKEGAWLDWDVQAASKLDSSLSKLAKFDAAMFPRFQWDNFAKDQKVAVWRQNLSATVAEIKALGKDWNSQIDGRVARLLDEDNLRSEGLAGELDQNRIFAALSDWASRNLRAASNFDEVSAFVKNGALASAGLSLDQLDQVAGTSAVSQAKFRMDSGVAPQDREQAIASAFAASVEDDKFTATLADNFATVIGQNPEGWSQKIELLKGKGLPVALYASSALLGAQRVVDSEAYGDGLQKTMTGLDRTAQDEVAARHDQGRDRLLQSLDAQSQEAQALNAKWGSLYRSYRRSAETAWEGMQADVTALRKGTTPDRMFEIADRLKKFLTDYDGAKDRFGDEVETAIQGQATELEKGGNPVVLLGFASRFKDDLGYGAGSLVDGAKSRLSTSILASPQIQSGLFVDGDQFESVNADWPKSKVVCIDCVYKLQPALVALIKSKQLEISGGSNFELTLENDGQEIRLKGSPAALFRGQRNASQGLKLHPEFVLKAPKLGIINEVVSVETDGPAFGDFDFEAPQIDLQLGQVQGRQVPVTVTVRDANPSTAAPRLTIGGRSVALTKSGANFRAALKLGAGIGMPNGNADTVSIAAEDDFGNKTELKNPQWASLVSGARRNLTAAEFRRIDQDFQNRTTRASGQISSKKIQDCREAVSLATKDLEQFGPYDRRSQRDKASSILTSGIGKARAWNVSGLAASSLTSMKSDFDSYFLALGSLGKLCGRSNVSSDQGNIWRNLVAQTNTTVSNPNPPLNGPTRTDPTRTDPSKRRTGPDYGRYQSGTVSALGINFIRVQDGPKPTWVAEVEVSQSFALRFDSRIVKEADEKAGDKFDNTRFVKKPNIPLAPISPRMAEKLVREINRSSDFDSLERAFGGPVKVVIPTESAWRAAGRLHTNGSEGYAFGSANVEDYRYGKFRQGRAGWYEGLKDVGSEGRGKFDFLSGNVAEIVRDGKSFFLKGGSMSNACFSDQFAFLRIDNQKNKIGKSRVKKFSGLRLAVEAK